MIPELSLFAGGLVTSAISVGAVRRYAINRSILDRPNERSSHSVPTPSGGGLGLILSFVVILFAYLVLADSWYFELVLPLAALTALAFTGWLDDQAGLSVRLRLAIHLVTGSALLPMALIGVEGLIGGVAVGMFWVLVAVTAINVVNFMDGIDGLIGTQLFLLGIHLVVLAPSGTPAQAWGLVLAATSCGFLVWNWPPARVFMGDAGSGALGLGAVGGGLLLVRSNDVPALIAFLPLYPLFLDATTTLMRRVLRNERIWEAHRSHLYQRLANGGWGHLPVTVAYAVAASLGIVVASMAARPLGTLLVVSYIIACSAAYALLNRVAAPFDSLPESVARM